MLYVTVRLKSVVSGNRRVHKQESLCPCVKYMVTIKVLPGHVNPSEETGYLCEGGLVTPEAWEVT